MGVRSFDPVKYDFLTKEDFVFLYDTASGGIHSWNPFKVGERILNFERSISEWIYRIERLLALHFICLAGTNDLLLVQMDHPEDHRVHVFTAPAKEPFEAPPGVVNLPECLTVTDAQGMNVSILFHI